MRSSIAIEVDAPPELVFRLSRDPLRWPALLPHYVRVRLVSRETDGAIVADYIAHRPLVPLLGLGIPVAWRSRSWSDPDACRLHFQHVAGATKGMDVTWRIEAVGGGSRVTIEHVFAPRIGPWAGLVDRLFIRPIASRTLATFKTLSESLREPGGESTDAPKTNMPV